MREAISSICIVDNQILLLKKKEVWILPGGKPDGDEDDLTCLIREHSEELPNAVFSIKNFYKEVTGITPHKGDNLLCKSYFANIKGSIEVGGEIADAHYFSLEELKKVKVSDITQKIIDLLLKDEYLHE